ncbi:hypothetical protein HGM15179_013475 [Zosterops borbonicus]|uniref:Envelope glycoprotein n=1 Tax=Zosterops borbonicus TaxID=364589 RepID=A0A8K1G7X8_9PASS|nr:hypothetical protein HGM15179_013475 [Zosterops borbonicus]
MPPEPLLRLSPLVPCSALPCVPPPVKRSCTRVFRVSSEPRPQGNKPSIGQLSRVPRLVLACAVTVVLLLWSQDPQCCGGARAGRSQQHLGAPLHTRSPLQTPAPSKPSKAPKQGLKSTTTKPIPQNPLSTHTTRTQDTREATPYDLFYRMLEAAFQSLNASEPNLTNSCWLCYDVNPPFYEGVALDNPFTHSNDPNPAQCRWNTPRKGINLALITGKGICAGSQELVAANKHICKVSVVLKRSYSWAVPSASGVWACRKTGVSPCISIKHFDFTNDFCVQVAVIPRVLYHTDDKIDRYIERDLPVQKGELVTGVTITALLGLGATGIATGVSALVSQKQGLTQLQMAIDEDLQRIEQSISLLEKSLSSLSEVVLQNRRRLDLLLMHQGGLCAALKEQCCFYANYSGVI